MEKKMIFTGFTCNSSALGEFTVGNEYLALNDDSCEYPENTSKSDGNDAFFIDDNGDGYWEYLCAFSEVKQEKARPIMTVEARDILDSIHETVGAETRSDSIVKFMEIHTEMSAELCSAKLGWSRELTRANNNDRLLTESRKQEAKVRCQNSLLKKKAQEYKVWTCVSILTAIAALVVLTIQS